MLAKVPPCYLKVSSCVTRWVKWATPMHCREKNGIETPQGFRMTQEGVLAKSFVTLARVVNILCCFVCLLVPVKPSIHPRILNVGHVLKLLLSM